MISNTGSSRPSYSPRVRSDLPSSPSRSQSSTARRTVYPAEDRIPASSSACSALSLSRTSCFSPAGDLPPDPLAISGVANRDGPDVPVLRRLEVDRVLAVPPALDAGLRHIEEPTSWLPVWLPRQRRRNRNEPLTCAPSR